MEGEVPNLTSAKRKLSSATMGLKPAVEDVITEEEPAVEMGLCRRGTVIKIVHTFRINMMRMGRHHKVLLTLVVILTLIQILRMVNGTGRQEKEKKRAIDENLRREYEKLQRFASENRDERFHGGGEIEMIMKNKEFLNSREALETKRVKEESLSKKKDKNDWLLCSNKKPDNPRFWPTIGNGHLATVVRSDTVFMNGLYNGNGTTTHRARIPAYISLLLANTSHPITEESYCLNMQTGIYTEVHKGNQFSITVKMYAHRRYTRLLVTEIGLQTDGQHGTQVVFKQNEGPASTDLHLIKGSKEFLNSQYVYGSILTPELISARKTPLHIYYSSYPPQFDIPGAVRNTFKKIYLMAASPFQAEARSAFQKGLEMYKDGTLETSHVKAWQEVWDSGRIDISGNSLLAKSAYSCLYYILSAMPTEEESSWPFIGLSPGDLGHGSLGADYNGHVFWDQDTWMYPPILVLNADLGKTIVKSRLRTLDNAYVNAELRGLKGAMYPWESAYEGLNVSPAPQTTIYELHVTGDVAFAFQQYLMMTQDKHLLQTGRLKEAITAMADFWISRTVYNSKENRYEIHNVMSADEWNWPVNNSVFTNQLVKMSLLLPKYACSLVSEQAPKKYEEVAGKMYILRDDKLKYHPEFQDYNLSIAVKQADVVLLGFPLDMPMDQEFRMNDLSFYEKDTPGGPAMTWGMYAIGWIEMGKLERAEPLFIRQLLNQQEPFHVWTETAFGEGATNFITGQGGFLQSIIFGYGGLRIKEDHIEMRCTGMPNSESFTIKNMDYLGNSLDIVCGPLKTEVTLTKVGSPLTLKVLSSGEKHDLYLGRTVIFQMEKFTIKAESVLLV